jgi:hypothetical protein
LEDYRKTFSLEKTFLDVVRKGVTSVLANHNNFFITLDHRDHHEEEKDGNISSSELLHKSGSTVGHSDSAQGSFFDKSSLLIVFEDHSTPSDQSKRVDIDM